MNPILRQRAIELGFDDCRITTAEPPQSAPQFNQWLKEGRHGEMAYLERNAYKRVNPQQVLPGAKSIITLAVSYAGDKIQSHLAERRPPGLRDSDVWSRADLEVRAPMGTNPPSDVRHPDTNRARLAADKPLRGLVARYACYQDYHDVLAKPLRELAEFVNRLGGPGTRSLWYVDTGPLLERDLAQRAGLGFIGKHSNLINRHLGNWFLISEIITTLELAPDEPEKNRCGTCARCMAACPTGAITAPFELDARRCISYLTIELKGPIPIEWRRAIGNRIFGCDICLEVCPWNRFAREGRLMQAGARPELGTPELLELLSLDKPGFKQRFAGTPVLRVKRRGLLRNVCVALGNLGDPAALPALHRAAVDAEPLIAEHARWAIEQIEGAK